MRRSANSKYRTHRGGAGLTLPTPYVTGVLPQNLTTVRFQVTLHRQTSCQPVFPLVSIPEALLAALQRLDAPSASLLKDLSLPNDHAEEKP